MTIITLDKVTSTNNFLKNHIRIQTPKDYTVVYAHQQTEGKGQHGKGWISEPRKNLTLSIYRDIKIAVADQFYLTMTVAIGLYRVLKKIVDDSTLAIKWPNDIMIGDLKICGILIENTVSETCLKDWIVGIGLNVNQTDFGSLTMATSLKNITGKSYDLEMILKCLLKEMQSEDLSLTDNHKPIIHHTYEQLLYKRNKVCVYQKLYNQTLFNGILRGVTTKGNLILDVEEQVGMVFNHRDIRLILRS